MATKKSIEDMFEELEEVLRNLESEDTKLEESFKIYDDGMKLVKEISTRIDKVEEKLTVLEVAE